jgi:hypothetical protein
MTRRIAVLAGLMAAGSLVIAAQQANFTGTVRNVGAPDVRAVRFEYDAGARSYWHAHEGAQILVLERGRGRVQVPGAAGPGNGSPRAGLPARRRSALARRGAGRRAHADRGERRRRDLDAASD